MKVKALFPKWLASNLETQRFPAKLGRVGGSCPRLQTIHVGAGEPLDAVKVDEPGWRRDLDRESLVSIECHKDTLGLDGWVDHDVVGAQVLMDEPYLSQVGHDDRRGQQPLLQMQVAFELSGRDQLGQRDALIGHAVSVPAWSRKLSKFVQATLIWKLFKQLRKRFREGRVDLHRPDLKDVRCNLGVSGVSQSLQDLEHLNLLEFYIRVSVPKTR